MDNKKKDRQKFWFCFIENGEYPKHRHYERNDAVREAERLAELTKQDVFLLEASEFVRYNPPVPPTTFEWKETLQ